MKTKHIFFACLLLSILGGCGKNNIIGNGKVIFQNREIKGYTSINVSGAYDIYLKKGETESLVIEADENLMDVIKTKLSGSTLEVNNSKNIIRSKDLKLIITNPKLNTFDFSGAIQLTSDTGLLFQNININISGIGRIDMNLKAEELTASASGGADLTFKGSSNKFDITITGTGTVDAEKLKTKECRVEISGLGKARLNVQQKLDVNISGFGKVDYRGNPQINQVISGAGKVNKLD